MVIRSRSARAAQGGIGNLERGLSLGAHDARDGGFVELPVALDGVEGLGALGFGGLDGDGLGLGGELDEDLTLLDLVAAP